MAKLDSLIVDLQVNTAELRKGLDEANEKLKGFGDKLESLAGVITFDKIGGMAKRAAEALVEFAQHGADVADSMGKAAAAAGISVESFSQIDYAAGLSGVSTEELSAAMNKLNKNIADAASGSKEQASLFKALGVDVRDSAGNVKGADVVFKELATTFDNLAPGASKAKLEMDLFGKTGAKFENVFKGGADGLKQLADEADRFGLTISTGAAASAEVFNDNMEKLRRVTDGVAISVAANVTPALTSLTSDLLTTRDGATSLQEAVEVLTAALKLLVSGAVIVGAVFDAVGTSIARVASGIMAAASGDFATAAGTITASLVDTTAIAVKASERISKVWDSSATAAKNAADDTANAHKKSADAIVANAERGKKAIDESANAMKMLEKVALDYETKIEGFGAGPLGELEARLNKGDLAAALSKIGDKAAEMRDRIHEAGEELQRLTEGRVVDKIDFSAAATSRAVGRDASSRRNAMDNVGESAGGIASQKTAGFSSFDQALDVLAKQTKKHTELLGTAELLRAKGADDAAAAMLVEAEQAQKGADAAAAAAEGFQTLAEIDFEQMQANIDQTFAAIGMLAGQLLGKMGELGDVIQAGVQGFQAGGWWGAIAGVLIEVFSKFERFQEIIDMGTAQLMDFIDILKPAFSALTDGFLDLMKLFGVVSKIIGQILGPAIRELGRMFEHIAGFLTPILAAVSTALEPIMSIISMFEDLIDSIDPLMWVMKIVAVVFNLVSLSILGTVRGIEQLWGWILEAVKAVVGLFTGTADIDKLIADNEKTKKETEAKMAKIIGKNGEGLFDSFSNADAPNTTKIDDFTAKLPAAGSQVTDLGKASADTAKSVAKLNAQLTNVPAGFRVNAARFNSTAATAVDPGGMFTPANVNFNIAGGVMTTLNQLQNAVRQGMTKDQWFSTAKPPGT